MTHPIGGPWPEPSTPPPGHSGVSDCQPDDHPRVEITYVQRNPTRIRAALLAAWPHLGDDPVHLDQLAEVAAAAVVSAPAIAHRAIARLTRELDDERGSHAMTRDHFTHYSEEWTAEIARQLRELAHLTQLLAGAQLARDQAQARVAAARQLAEEWRRPGYWAGAAPSFAEQLDAALDNGSRGD